MKQTYQVRDVATPFNLGGGFRDDLIASAMALSLLVVGSFVLTAVYFGQETDSKVSPSPAIASPQTLGAVDVASPTPINLLPSPTLVATHAAGLVATQSATAAAEGAVVAPVVPFGDDGTYDFSAYTIAFSKPRLEFDAAKNTKRTFVVEVTLTNKTVLEGLETRLVASIVKDGKVIVPSAALFVPNRQTVPVNQQAVFRAEINLVDGTDVRELRFEPGGDLPATSHFLYQ